MGFAPDMIDLTPPFMMLRETLYECKRYETWYSKEPETIAWIDSFTDGDLFFDIGANVGVYSLYCASVHPHCSILACEPDAKNFARLRENIDLNALWNITPAQYAISDKNGAGTFYEAGIMTGESGGQLNSPLCNGMAAYPVAVTTIDALVTLHGCPQHIKVDIDGQELRVVKEMRHTLRNPSLRSVLIEFEQIACSTALDFSPQREPFIHCGFTINNRFNTMTPHSRERRAQEHIRVENVIFTRG